MEVNKIETNHSNGEAPIKKEFLRPKSSVPSSELNIKDKNDLNKEKINGKTFKKRHREEKNDNNNILCNILASGKICNNDKKCTYSHDIEKALKNRPKDIGLKCPIYYNNNNNYCKYGINCRFGLSHMDPITKKNIAENENNTINHIKPIISFDLRKTLRKQLYPFKTISSIKNRNKNNGKESNKEKNLNVNNNNNVNIENIDNVNNIDSKNIKDNFILDNNNVVDDKNQIENKSNNHLMNDNNNNSEKTTILMSKKELRIQQLYKKDYFKDKIYIAPLTTVGNLPFRRIMVEQEADITCGEMAMIGNILNGNSNEIALLKRHKSEKYFGVQLAGGHPDQMARCTELLTNLHLNSNDEINDFYCDFMDLNIGCPIDLVCKQNAGASLMYQQNRLLSVTSAALTGIQMACSNNIKINNSNIPFLTIKMRTGWDHKNPNAHKLVKALETVYSDIKYVNPIYYNDYYNSQHLTHDYVHAITIHGRSRLMRYSKTADWNYIIESANQRETYLSNIDGNQSKQISMIGNGDIFSYEDFNKYLQRDTYLDNSNENEQILDTCMIGRGALIKPWLPREIKEKCHIDISSNERFDILKQFVNYGLEHWGSDQRGVNTTRRYLLEWLSFLCRYIPIGLLERIPQKLNDRPPSYFGRNDLETLMVSDQAKDWIKISEMLLGPIPEGFQFFPKHKANSYT